MVVNTRRLAVSAAFGAAGIGLGAWGACLPLIKQGLALSDGELGSALLCFALGAMLVMPVIGRLAVRVGGGLLGLVGGCGFALALMATAQAPGLAVLAACILLMGLCFGALDVAMNLLAAAVERAAQVPIMASFHAAYSIGLLGGAILSGALFGAGFGAAGTLFVACALIFAIFAIAGLAMRPIAIVGEGGGSGAPRRQLLRDPVVLAMGGLAFLAFFVEGAMADWAAIYVVQQVGLDSGGGAVAFSLFAAAMAVGRIGGGRLQRALGPVATIGLSAILAILGLGAAAAFPAAFVVLPAFALVGFGIANIIPVVFSAAGRQGGDRATRIFPAVVGIGYVGVMVGPPVIGAIAEHFTLRGSLFVLVLALSVVLLFRRRVA
ncbi:MFS transporter [Zavarzinia aquatilis]|uniref:MFS transporter n=1 Tax=Zavarzinia aquatilis TaxID=2211142 RepID=A0A317E5J3_9PROT|nr:MFS transporter [Zavarzinia aquatilis]PWR21460.1 MFS transporter [Zavarzinia aquatilis]